MCVCPSSSGLGHITLVRTRVNVAMTIGAPERLDTLAKLAGCNGASVPHGLAVPWQGRRIHTDTDTDTHIDAAPRLSCVLYTRDEAHKCVPYGMPVERKKLRKKDKTRPREQAEGE